MVLLASMVQCERGHVDAALGGHMRIDIWHLRREALNAVVKESLILLLLRLHMTGVATSAKLFNGGEVLGPHLILASTRGDVLVEDRDRVQLRLRLLKYTCFETIKVAALGLSD